jgi:hypothetical protein
MRFDVPAFIKDYTECVVAGLTLAEIGQVMGLRPSVVGQRVCALTRRGIPLPKRKHGLKNKPGRPCPFKGQKLGPRKKGRALQKTARVAESVPFTMPAATFATGFVITVGN